MLTITWLDAIIILGFLASVVLVGSLAAKRSGKSADDFFLSGRKMPWWLLGVSMVACTFSCDTPNLITEIVRLNGVAGNWVWWAFLLTGMLTVFVYANLWRRSGLSTDLGFYELRYSGRPAAFLRGFRAIYLGVVYNLIILGGVSLAAIKIGQIMFGLTPGMSLLCAMTGVAIYATLGGLTGSMWADFYQFSVAMTGAVFAAWYAVNSGMADGVTTLKELFAHPAVSGKLALVPSFSGDLSTLMTVMILPLAVQWWNVWYPGAEPGGGGFIAQRMLAAKSEGHAVGGTLLFNVLHYAVRPWPWILVAFASLAVFPLTPPHEQDAAKVWLAENPSAVSAYAAKAEMPAELRETVRRRRAEVNGVGALAREFPNVDDQFLGHDIAYPGMVARMPRGWQGLIVASLIAAYMSTVATLLNWGSSYVVQDVYLRFIKPQASQRHAVLVGRVTMLAMLLVSAAVALQMTTVKTIFHVLLQVGAGTGLIYILRWFWWRMNVWSEVTAMVVSFLVAIIFQFGAAPLGLESAMEGAGWFRVMDFTSWKMVLGIIVTTAAWLAVTYLTPPVDERTLVDFYRKIRPGGPGWKRIEKIVVESDTDAFVPAGWNVPTGILCMLLGCLMVWAALFGVGHLLYGRTISGSVMAGVAALAAWALVRLVPRIAANGKLTVNRNL